MSQITAQTLNQARESLVEMSRQRTQLTWEVQEQGRKIVDLEREVQKQATALSAARQLLSDAAREIESLRSQIPDAATRSAFDALTEYLCTPASAPAGIRIAA